MNTPATIPPEQLAAMERAMAARLQFIGSLLSDIRNKVPVVQTLVANTTNTLDGCNEACALMQLESIVARATEARDQFRTFRRFGDAPPAEPSSPPQKADETPPAETPPAAAPPAAPA